MKYPDKDDFPILHHLDGFPPTKSASLHTQRVQFMRIKRGERSEKTSQYHGVSRDSRPPHWWRVVITNQDAKLYRVYLGSFATEKLAARAYDLVSLASYGPEGVTNFPQDDYRRMSQKWAEAAVADFASGERVRMKGAREALAKAAQHVATQAAGKST